jgi:outer membrane protein assembly factor BamA
MNIAKDILVFATLPDTLHLVYEPYKTKLKIESISNVGFGVGNSYYGWGVSGGVNLLFGDVLGEHRAFVGFSGGNGLESLSGQIAYLNQKNRLWWGATITHTPYQMGNVYYKPDTLVWNTDTLPVLNAVMDILTIFNDNLTLFATYPFTQTRRLEFAVSGSVYSFLHTVYNNYFSGYLLLAADRERLDDTPPAFGVITISPSYIDDNSYFGMTSPLKGHIYSIFPTLYAGKFNLISTYIDLRRYVYLKPVSFAFRLLQSYRFGKDAENGSFPDFYLPYPWYVRGYTDKALLRYVQMTGNQNLVYSLTGSRLVVANFEIRLPFIGIDRLALIPSKFLFMDLNAFFDAGVTWYSNQKISFDLINPDYTVHTPLLSTGLSARINVFGQIIIEPYVAYPLSLKGYGLPVFGLNLMSGW